MQKLKLDLDALNVTSFATGAGADAQGTIRAHSDPVVTTVIITTVTPPVISYMMCEETDQERADRLADSLRKNAARLHGTITRHGRITVLYTKVAPGATGKPDARIEGCV